MITNLIHSQFQHISGLINMWVYITAIILAVYGIYFWLIKNNDHWKKRSIPFAQPRVAVGNMGEVVLMMKSQGVIVTELYNKYKNVPYVGLFDFRKPVLLVRDPNIIKNVLVTEFNKFHDNTFQVNEEADPILAKNPFFLRGERWKIVRAQLTPLLTNTKVKAMFPLVEEVCKDMVKYLETDPQATGKDGIEAKELALKFTSDNVASCAFGLQGRAFEDPNAEFRTMAEQFLHFDTLKVIKFVLISIFPFLTNTLKVPTGDAEISDKFKAILQQTVKYRKDNKIKRNDFLDSIIELKSKPMPFEYTDDYMVAHALTFFLDGSETSAVAFSFALYEIAANPNIQNKLQKEVHEILSKHNGQITFEAIHEMTYLDAVFQETLRKYPPLMFMSRTCNEETKFPSLDDSDKYMEVEKDTHVYIPVYAIHRDHQFYPDPDHFDPDRFTKDAKHPLPKNCFFGFGDGPRICLGQRFANMQVKAGLIAAVLNFEIRVNNKTKQPLEIDPKAFLLAAAGGIWLNFHKRKRY